MALADIYQVKHNSLNAGESMLNVYQVERSDPGFNAADITLAFQESIMPALAPAQGLNTNYLSVVAQSLGNPIDFDTRIQTGQTGTHTGASAPTSLAFSIRFPRQRTDMRDGFKRWGGMTETMYTGQDTDGAFQGLMSTLGLALLADWEHAIAPGVPVCRYIILKRVCNVQPPPTPCPSYRLPESDGELVFYQPLSFQFKVSVRTQVSRRVPA